MRRVVVTGLGLATPLGVGVKKSFDALTRGVCAISQLPSEIADTTDLLTTIGACVPGTYGEDTSVLDAVVSQKDQRKMDRFIQLGLLAAAEAIVDSGWTADTDEKAERTGVMVGSGIGGLPAIEENVLILKERGARRISPFFIPASLINLLSGHISINYNFKGPNHAAVTACATGAHAIADAARLIRNDEADVIVAGGAEASICRIGIAGFNACRALSTNNENPQVASRPWDKARDGFVMGEGSGILVLEEYEHAKRRGAKIYAEVIGYGLTGDAYHLTSPSEDGDGARRAIVSALRMAKIDPSQVGYINAHATSTNVGDLVEMRAMKAAFGGSIYDTAISSTKSSIGHLLGAAGSVESIFSILAMREGVLPPTINLQDPEEECEGLNLVANKAQEKKCSVVLSNSFGFGGTNISILFGKI